MEELANEIIRALRKLRGLDLSNYREGIIENRINERISILELRNEPNKYLEQIRSDSSECGKLIDAVTVQVRARA